MRCKSVLVSLLLFGLLLPAVSWAQPVAPPCVIDTPAQRAIWDRMKAENHPGYQQIKLNTTLDRYGDLGRWEMLAAVIDRDATMAQKSFAETKAATGNWLTIFKGDMSREHAIELAMRYGCLYTYLTVPQATDYRAYLMAMSESTLAGLRIEDSDQITGNYFGLTMADKVLGTTYANRTYKNLNTGAQAPVGGLDATAADFGSMANAVRLFFEKMGAGGTWPEGQMYNEGTTWLAVAGAYWTGIEHYPWVRTWLKDRVNQQFFELTSNLKDAHKWGDIQQPRIIRPTLGYIDAWSMWQALLDADGEPVLAAKLRQLANDMNAAHGITALNPLYARVYYAHNPYGTKQPWRVDGTWTAVGTGNFYWREGVRSGMIHCPNQQNGLVDHFQANGSCTFRINHDGVWVVDHRLAYAPDQRSLNGVLINGTGPALELGGLIASHYIPGKIVYAAGLNAGASSLVNTSFGTPVGADGTVPYTFTLANQRSIAQLLDGTGLTVLMADRVQADDAKLETLTTKAGTVFGWDRPSKLYNYPAQQNVINQRLGVVDWLWHTTTKPVVAGNVFSADGITVTRLLPAVMTTTVVNQALHQDDPLAIPYGYCAPYPQPPKLGCLGGNIFATERKWVVHETLPTHQPFQLQLRVVSDEGAVSTRIDAGEMQGVRIARPGLKDVVVFFSNKPGPPLMTSTGPPNQWGAVQIRYDRTKFDTVKQGRLVTVRPPAPAGATTYYADMGEALIAAEAPPPSSESPQDLIQQLKDLLDKLAGAIQQVK